MNNELINDELINWWKPKLGALDPWRALGADEIRSLYTERFASPARDLAEDLKLEDRPAEVKVLLCGARGSGKTTELMRLAGMVGDEFCVVHANLLAGLPEGAGTLAIVTLLGAAALHTISAWSRPDSDLEEPAKPDGGLLSRGREALEEALSRFGAAAPSLTKILDAVSPVVTVVSPPAGVGLAGTSAAIKGASAVTGSASELRHALEKGPLKGRLSPDNRDNAKAVVDAVNQILADLHELAGRPPLLLADGLDKWTEVEEVAVALGDKDLLDDLLAPLVITGPVNLRYQARFFGDVPGGLRLALLYNVPVCKRSEGGQARPCAEGIELLCDLYERRRAAAELPPSLMGAQVLEQAARMSAGLVREFLGLLHSAGKGALRLGRQEVTSEDLAAAIKSRRLEMEGYLNQGHVELLRRVLDKGTLPAGKDTNTLLIQNFITCYPNGDLWFRPHEIIVEFIQAQSDQ